MNKYNFFNISAFTALTFTLLAGSCRTEDKTEQETITTIEVHVKGGNFDKKFYWRDKDGDGGANPVIDTIELPANTLSLLCDVHVYDESKIPTGDITEEIRAEAEDHLLVYRVSGVNLSVAYNDRDTQGKNLGISTIWTTSNPSRGTLNILLYHEPADKANVTDPGGDVDFDVVLPVKIL